MPAQQRTRLTFGVVGLVLAGLAPALAQLDYGFMPKGGKSLLLEVLGQTPDDKEVREIVGSSRSGAEWRTALAERGKALSERELRTLAAYLEVNMPVSDPAALAAKASQPQAMAKALPRDGRELGWEECQFCHSLFTSHLTQDRSVQAWRNMFESPFHRELKMPAQEREEFSRYSAINMPMKMEDVPPDLRF